MSRYPPVKTPSNENVIRSSIASVPSGSTVTWTSASGSENDRSCAAAGPARTSETAAAAAAGTSRRGLRS